VSKRIVEAQERAAEGRTLLGEGAAPRGLRAQTRISSFRRTIVVTDQTTDIWRIRNGKSVMNRIAGLEKNQAPWHLRWFYTTMRKMFGKDLTPVKQQMRVPGMVWGAIAMEAGLGEKRKFRCGLFSLAKVRTAARVGCPF
jgi:hypothetical protein